MKKNTKLLTNDQFAKSLIAHLDTGNEWIKSDVAERLRFARERAISVQKQTSLEAAWTLTPQMNGSFALGGSNFNWFNKIGTLLPLLALIAGLFAIHHIQTDIRAQEVAAVDAALLTDDLPPAAYTDAGFGQFLKLQAGR